MERKRNVSLKPSLFNKARRDKLARLRLRAAIRFAYENHTWLEDTVGEELGMNVAKNIRIIQRRKKNKENLTLKEKAMMRVQQEYRTEYEKNHLRRVLGLLKIFGNYPLEVKNELATITHFVQYEAERTIVKEGDEATALFFIVSGSVRVVEEQFDPLIRKNVKVILKVKQAGELFGELALLLGETRTATIITNELSEFIYINKADYDRVLKETVLKEWNDIKMSMAMFDYFKSYDDRHLQSGYMASKMLYYPEKSLILSEDYGDQHLVYFLIEGHIELMECMELKVIQFRNKKSYKLYNSHESSVTPKPKDSLTSDRSVIMRTRSKIAKSEVDLNHRASVPIITGSIHSIKAANMEEYLMRNSMELRKSLKAMENSGYVSEDKKNEIISTTRRSVYDACLDKMHKAARVNFVKQFEGELSRNARPMEAPKYTIETHFMRVATMSPLGTFNIGEHLDSRYYVTRTKAKILAIPKYWLFKRDKATWNNLTIFLRTRLPSRQQLFENFKNRKSWMRYRKEVFNNIADRCTKTNMNCINNVPLSIRLDDDVDFFVHSRDLSQNNRNNKPRSVENWNHEFYEV